jgi:hypothetical protein
MELAPGRDNPHSRGDEDASLEPVGAGLVLAAAVAAVWPLPPTWRTSPEHPAVLPTPGALGWLWDDLLLLLPAGERGVRGELGVLLLVLAAAGAAGVLALRLFRGTGRGAAAACAPPVAATLLLLWVSSLGAATRAAARPLACALLATLALAAVLGARVRGRGVSPGVWARGGAAALAAALVWPRAGLGVAAAVLAYAAWHRRPVGAARGPWRREAAALALALAPALAAGWMTWPSGHVPADMVLATGWFAAPELVAPLPAATRLAGAAMVYPALALLLLLVWPLRWRGGGLLLGLAAAAAVGDAEGPLLPAPLVLVLVAVAACGWIWLAGGLRARSSPWTARAAAAVAAVAVLGLAAWQVPGPRARAPVSERRPEAALLAVVQRGLIAPGDVLLAHDPWLAAAFAAAQRDEGLRPDVELHAAAALDPERLSDRLAGWARAGRRVLSDSFSFAGRWQPAWVLDSGPLFWFVGTAGADEREFTDLRGFSPDLRDPRLAPVERARWERLHVERARYRRGLGEPDEALAALPLADDELTALLQRLQFARLSRLAAVPGSELGPAPWPAAPPPAAALAEAGDLLLALGDGDAGAERLAQSAAAGVAGAFGALARWHLRAGEEAAAQAVLAEMAASPALRGEVVALCHWLLARARVEPAAALLARLPPVPAQAPEELAARLAVLRARALP